jgi:hypothetical protein
LYNECTPETFEDVFRRTFGMDIDALEAEFWEEARRRAKG